MESKLPAVAVTNLSLELRGVLVLESITFNVEQGEFLGLIGPNGGGKSVLLKTLVGLIEPTSGSVQIFGKSPKAARGSIGYVPQFARFDTHFPVTVLDVVLMGRLGLRPFTRAYSAEDRTVAQELLVKVQLADAANQHIGKLSGGQLQRVLIARALAGEPKLLLLDEPTASLDSRVGQNFYDLLKELSRSLTIVLVSHDIGVIAEYVRAVACLNRKLHFHSSKELTSEMIEEVYGCPVELLAHGHAHRVLGSHHHEPEE